MKEHYREMFESSPIPLWEEDFTDIRQHLNTLQRFGVTDLKEYFWEHPSELPKCVGMIKIKDVNRQAIKVFKAQFKEDLLTSLVNVFTKETMPVFIESLLSIARGQTEFESEVVHQTLKNDRIVIKLNWTVVMDKVIVSTQDITERKLADKRLQEYQVKLKSLASELSLAEERERKRIAIELHDHIGQSLAISKMKLDHLRQSVISEGTAEILDEVCHLLEDMISNTTSLTYDLRSPILDELGFSLAVEAYLTDEIEKKHGILTEFENDKSYEYLSEDLRGLLFRNVREVLTNIVKHAHAKSVKVSIKQVDSLLHIVTEVENWRFNRFRQLYSAMKLYRSVVNPEPTREAHCGMFITTLSTRIPLESPRPSRWESVWLKLLCLRPRGISLHRKGGLWAITFVS